MMPVIRFILSLISAVVSLIYVVASYYGLLRYCALYTWGTGSYVERYQSLDSMSTDRVTIVIATTPNRLSKLEPVVRSLLDQTVKVDSISIVIPNNPNFPVPESLADAVSVVRCGVDRGPVLNAILSTLSRESSAGTRAIIVRDNVIYGKTYVETLLDREGDDRVCIKAPDGLLIEIDQIEPLALKNPPTDAITWMTDNIPSPVIVEYPENWKAIQTNNLF